MLKHSVGGLAIFQLGFRPFFLAAGLFAVVSMFVWLLAYSSGASLLPENVSPLIWHAHEMVYGYGMAVVAGFLLTAVKNWTGMRTAHGFHLLLLFLIWLAARFASVVSGEQAVLAALVLDNIFLFLLSVTLTVPLVRSRNWRNMGLISNLYILQVAHAIYTLGLFGIFADGGNIGIHAGLYLILSLLFILLRRVLPMFIERGAGYAVSLKKRAWVDHSILLLFPCFIIADIFLAVPVLTACISAALFLLHSQRLWDWHTPGIWKRPLLWVLYLAYVWLIIGFALKFAVFAIGLSASLAIHAFTVGGIGMFSIGMISRVSLGHTGRDVTQAPSGLWLAFFMLFLCGCMRVVMPMVLADLYMIWIGLSQFFWIIGFLIILKIYTPILLRPRIDGNWG